MAADWYVQHMGETIGPLPVEELEALAQDGRLTTDVLVRRGDNGQWTAAGNVKGLFDRMPISSPATSQQAAKEPKGPAPSGASYDANVVAIVAAVVIGAVFVGVLVTVSMIIVYSHTRSRPPTPQPPIVIVPQPPGTTPGTPARLEHGVIEGIVHDTEDLHRDLEEARRQLNPRSGSPEELRKWGQFVRHFQQRQRDLANRLRSLELPAGRLRYTLTQAIDEVQEMQFDLVVNQMDQYQLHEQVFARHIRTIKDELARLKR